MGVMAPMGGQKIRQVFSNPQGVYFPEKCDELSELLAKNWGILQTRMDQRGDYMKMNFKYFQIQKWIWQTVRSEKLDDKNGVICLVSMFYS